GAPRAHGRPAGKALAGRRTPWRRRRRGRRSSGGRAERGWARSRDLLPQAAHREAQLLDGLGADLRDAGLGQLEDRRDLVELQLLEVVERENHALLLLELEDRLAEDAHLLLQVELVLDAVVLVTGEELRRGGCALLGGRGGDIEREVEDALDVGLPAPVGIHVDAELAGDRLIVRAMAEAAGQRFPGAADVPALLANRAGYVVLAAELVEDRAADAGCGEGAER